MPIYEFQCNDCSAVFETLTTSSSTRLVSVCPKCQSENTKKILSAGSFKLAQGHSAPACGQSSGCAARKGFT